MPIIITGMHRSGTSLTAAILNDLGVYLGLNQELMSAAADNPDGFYERWDVVRLNDALLKRAGATWHEPPATGRDFWQQGLEEPLRQLQDHAARVISRLNEQSEEWAIKDPRFSLTSGFWQPLLPDARYLICIRHPLEVAASLAQRQGFEQTYALTLWQQYYQWLEASTRPEQRRVVAYQDLMTRGSDSIMRLVEWLGLQPKPSQLAQALQRIRPELHHHHEAVGANEFAPTKLSAEGNQCGDELIRTAEGNECRCEFIRTHDARSRSGSNPAVAEDIYVEVLDTWQRWLQEARQDLDIGYALIDKAWSVGVDRSQQNEEKLDKITQAIEINRYLPSSTRCFPLHKLPGFLESVRGLNTFLHDNRLLVYQASILAKGHFSIVSPFDGVLLETKDSLFLQGQRIAYFFAGQMPFWIMTGEIQFGYPLTWLYCPGNRILIRLAEGGTGVQANIDPADYWFNKIRQALQEREAAEKEVSNPVIIMGHRNFAHHLWNELPALAEWLNQTRDSDMNGITLVPVREPLGPLDAIFPELESMTLLRTDTTPRDINNIPGSFVLLGSRKVSRQVRDRLTKYLEQRASDTAHRLEQDFLQHHQPVFWFSVREHNGTCLNQMEFLEGLALRLLETYPDSRILLDGFAFPPFESDLNTLLAAEQRAISLDCFMENLKKRLATTGGAEIAARLCSVSGLSLPDNLYLARHVDYYVCHAGTLQHKLGWLYPIHGIIHTAAKDENACRALASWHGNQVENGCKPVVLPACYVSLLAKKSPEQPDRNRNYQIDYIPGAIDFILQDCTAALNHRDTLRRD